jgi:hypothetical protein
MAGMCFRYYKKKGIPTKDEFNYGTNKHPSAKIYQSAQSRRLSSFSRIHTIDRVKHTLVENSPVLIALPLYNSGPTFWKSNNDQAVSIEGYDTNGFFFRNSWGTDWGGATMAVAICHSLTGGLVWGLNETLAQRAWIVSAI